MFTPEYVNIFGIPFTFLPHESDETGAAPTTPPKTQMEALKERADYEISSASVEFYQIGADGTNRPHF